MSARIPEMIWASAVLAMVCFMPRGGVAQDAPTRVLFTNVGIFDGVNDGVLVGMNVLVEGNLIAEISSSVIRADGATVIDGGGRTLMPGLIDNRSGRRSRSASSVLGV